MEIEQKNDRTHLFLEIEKTILTRALARSSSIRVAARALEISHTSLINKLRKHQIRVEKK